VIFFIVLTVTELDLSLEGVGRTVLFRRILSLGRKKGMEKAIPKYKLRQPKRELKSRSAVTLTSKHY
jgi:hypothetical protein